MGVRASLAVMLTVAALTLLFSMSGGTQPSPVDVDALMARVQQPDLDVSEKITLIRQSLEAIHQHQKMYARSMTDDELHDLVEDLAFVRAFSWLEERNGQVTADSCEYVREFLNSVASLASQSAGTVSRTPAFADALDSLCPVKR